MRRQRAVQPAAVAARPRVAVAVVAPETATAAAPSWATRPGRFSPRIPGAAPCTHANCDTPRRKPEPRQMVVNGERCDHDIWRSYELSYRTQQGSVHQLLVAAKDQDCTWPARD